MRLPSPYRSEADIVARCLERLAGTLDWGAAAQSACPWIQAVRDHPPPFWAMESLLHEYPISSAEGLALMRLAEALLRVPDAETAIALTADQLGRADFAGGADSALGRLSSAAIAMSKKLLPHEGDAAEAPGVLVRLGARGVVAASLRAVQLLGRQFVFGADIAHALKAADAARAHQARLCFSFDMLGEGARTDTDALRYLASYSNAIKALAASDNGKDCTQRDGISIKLSALYPRYDYSQHGTVMGVLVPRVWALCELAARANINLTLDAEEVERLELSLDVFEGLAALVAQHHPAWRGFGLALQAYQTRALELVEHVIGLARQYKLHLMCRLVKGAYWDAEIKRAQELGLAHYPVFTHKQHTDISWLACARLMLTAPDAIYTQFATHNAVSIAAVEQMARQAGAPFELQRLHGMGEGIYREVLKNPLIACRVYAPVGQQRDLLAYLVRRLLENGANSSFVHQLADESVGLDVLLRSPLQLIPDVALPLPADLYATPANHSRKNSAGLDLAVSSVREALLMAYRTTFVPDVTESNDGAIAEAVQRGLNGFQRWHQTDASMRAAMLRHAADALEARIAEFAALLVKEARKTWGDAVAEVRESVDFLRYYADEAERIMLPVALPGPTGESNVLRLRPRGVWLSISPWNFPLAIFIGQIAAALVTGNTVLAKPAEQTPGVAQAAVALLHAYGIPQDAVQLLHGAGETVGAHLVACPEIAGVVFTGSFAVAKTIQRALAAKEGPIVPLIAETGGINTMLVDSSALPEQVADAVLQSAFRSAGQRCSALRLLCVHDEIADRVIELIVGAAQALIVGDPADFSTDVGPVIDGEAYALVMNEIQRLKHEATTLLAPTKEAAAETRLIAPHAFEVPNIADLKHEIFGPVLHVVRWAGDPIAVIKQVNALGYGLTLGLQTRIDSRADMLSACANIGNVYVNRSTIGAVVGVQPFGGEGLSGTGPKAGGPNYLQRFCSEQTLTVNTSAAGGNAALLARLDLQ